jgi:hypothetical protein
VIFPSVAELLYTVHGTKNIKISAYLLLHSVEFLLLLYITAIVEVYSVK